MAKKQRRRVKHHKTFEERLAVEALKFKEAAEQEPPGSTARELHMQRARQAETALDMVGLLRSSGPMPAKVRDRPLSDQEN